MSDMLDRPIDGQNPDGQAIPSQGGGLQPEPMPIIQGDAMLPGDFPPGGAGLLGAPGAAAQPVPDPFPAERDAGAQGQPGQMDLFRGSVVALEASLSPGIGLRFLAWQRYHLNLLYTQDAHGSWVPRYPLPTQFSMYLEDATSRDALEDAGRPADRRSYDFGALHIDGYLQNIQAETDAHREEIADGLRATYQRKGKALGIPQAKLDQLLA